MKLTFKFSLTLLAIIFLFTACSTMKSATNFIKCDTEEASYTLKKGSKEVKNEVTLRRCEESTSFTRAKGYAVVERWDKALAELKKDAEAYPNIANVHYNLGVAYEANGQFSKALIEYDKAFDLNPEEMLYQRAWKRAKEASKELNSK
jgi:tetratricopeptide (TPR) repeat protein